MRAPYSAARRTTSSLGPRTQSRDGGFGLLKPFGAGALCLSLILLAKNADAAFTQAGCGGGTLSFPTNIGASEFTHAWSGPSTYGNYENRTWYILANSNVRSITFNYTNFNTEAGYDYLAIDYRYGTHTLTGNLGNGAVTLGPLGYGTSLVRYGVTWHADYSIVMPSIPTLNSVNVTCHGAVNPTVQHLPLTENNRTKDSSSRRET